MVDKVFKRLVGLLRVFSERSSSDEGRRARELSLTGTIRGKLPSRFLKVAAGRNNRDFRNDGSKELVKVNRVCVVVSDAYAGLPVNSTRRIVILKPSFLVLLLPLPASTTS